MKLQYLFFVASFLLTSQTLLGNEMVDKLTWEFKGQKIWKLPSTIQVEEKKYWMIYKRFNSKDGYPDDPVHDYLELPSVPDKYTLVNGQCYFDGQYDESLFAYVVVDLEIEKWLDVYVAYKIDGESRKVIPLDVSKVSCLNDGWGV
ncbi:hypothetical protein [Shewanella psychromarinicola]|jgi:hypothetical protein|uniref:hypothetical protein n=1 Tax=Shewanella psychromarinicola TaxID=2487742 RepID=UPI003F4BFB46